MRVCFNCKHEAWTHAVNYDMKKKDLILVCVLKGCDCKREIKPINTSRTLEEIKHENDYWNRETLVNCLKCSSINCKKHLRK